jgi:hypothetical protein
MSGELLFVLVIAGIVAAVAIIARAGRKRRAKNRLDWERFYLNPEIEQTIREQREELNSAAESADLGALQSSKQELDRLRALINERKRFAWETDISYHVWSLYRANFRLDGAHLKSASSQNAKWYELKILRASNVNQVRKFDFELNGVRYRFVDDEETQKIMGGIRLFNLCLYDEADRCLMDIPMKLRVDEFGKTYAVSSDSPRAFILGDWFNDFIKVSLKHQNIRNQEIRAQKHQERLREIEELKDKFGIAD